MSTYFENLTIRLHILYTLNIHLNFMSIKKKKIIQFINFFFFFLFGLEVLILPSKSLMIWMCERCWHGGED